MELKVAGAQMPVTRDVESNEAGIMRAIEFAVEQKAHILLTPEGSLSGYTAEFDQGAVEKALERVTAEASQARLGLALGTCVFEPEDGRCYNQIRFHARDGAHLGFHSKTLRCGSMSKPPKGEINDYAVTPLRTFDFEGVRIGGLICNDLWANPRCTPMPDTHLAQQLSDMGAKVIFHAVNGGRSGSDWDAEVAWPFHESNLRMRALSGKVWIVTADNAHPTSVRCSAPSGVVNPDGAWACKTEPKGEQHFACTIELE